MLEVNHSQCCALNLPFLSFCEAGMVRTEERIQESTTGSYEQIEETATREAFSGFEPS